MIPQISYNVLIDRFRAFAEAHFLIKGFSHGDLSNIDIEKEVEFPWMHVLPVEVEPRAGSRLYSFVIIFADLPRDKETPAEYQRECISDCIKLAEDLLAEVQNGQVVFGPLVELDGGANIEVFINEFSHTLVGVNLQLTLSVPWDWSACDIPADFTIGGSGSGGEGVAVGITLQTNGVNNGLQSLLNLQQGTNVTIVDNGNGTVTINSAGGGGGGTVTSVALTVPSAFAVTGSPITGAGTLAITANGTSVQYIDGTGTLQTFPTIPSPQNLQQVTDLGFETTNSIISKNVFGFMVKTSINQVLADMKPNGAGNEGILTLYSNTGLFSPTIFKRTGINNMDFPTSGSGVFALSVNGVTPNATTGDITIATGSGTVTSVGLTMPAPVNPAFTVSGSPVTTSGTLAVSANGTASQYVDGTGALQNFPALSGFVPYVGATQDVDLDANKLSAESVYIEGTNGAGHLHLKHQNADATATGQSTALWADTNGDIKWKNDGNYKTTLKSSSNTADRVYTFPNEDAELMPRNSAITPGTKTKITYDADGLITSGADIVAADISNSTTVGQGLITLANPSAVRYLRINADNTISALTLAQLKTDIGLGSAIVETNQSNVGVVFEDVTGLSFAVTANKTYKWRATISYALTGGASITFSSNGPATSLNNARFTTATALTTNTISNQAFYDAGTNAVASSNALSTADGIFRVTASGTWTIRMRCSAAGALTVRAGSIVEFEEVL